MAEQTPARDPRIRGVPYCRCCRAIKAVLEQELICNHPVYQSDFILVSFLHKLENALRLHWAPELIAGQWFDPDLDWITNTANQAIQTQAEAAGANWDPITDYQARHILEAAAARAAFTQWETVL